MKENKYYAAVRMTSTHVVLVLKTQEIHIFRHEDIYHSCCRYTISNVRGKDISEYKIKFSVRGSSNKGTVKMLHIKTKCHSDACSSLCNRFVNGLILPDLNANRVEFIALEEMLGCV